MRCDLTLMKMKLLLVFINAIGLFLTGCTKVEVSKSEVLKPAISIDCTEKGLVDYSAGVIFESINNIVRSSDRGVLIEFFRESETIYFFITTSEEMGDIIKLPPVVEFRPQAVIIEGYNGGPKSLIEFDKWLQVYADECDSLSATAVLSIKAPEWVSLAECFSSLKAIFDHGIHNLVIATNGEQGSGQQSPASSESKTE